MNELLDMFNLSFEAYLHGPVLLLALVATGLVVGILTGMFGVGGGFLVNPLLMILLGIQETLVVGSSLCFTIGTAAAGTARHWRLGNVDPKTVIILVAAALPGVLAGKTLHVELRDALGPDWFAVLFRTFYLAMLLLTAWIVYSHPGQHHSGKSLLQRMPIGPYVNLTNADLDRTSLPGLCMVGVSIGLAKGLLGIGGGVMFVPMLLVVVGLRTHLAIGTSLGVVLLSSMFGTLLYSDKGVNLLLVMALLVGSASGVQIGAWLCDRLHGGKLRRYFVYVVMFAAALVAVDLVLKAFQ